MHAYNILYHRYIVLLAPPLLARDATLRRLYVHTVPIYIILYYMVDTPYWEVLDQNNNTIWFNYFGKCVRCGCLSRAKVDVVVVGAGHGQGGAGCRSGRGRASAGSPGDDAAWPHRTSRPRCLPPLVTLNTARRDDLHARESRTLYDT